MQKRLSTPGEPFLLECGFLDKYGVVEYNGLALFAILEEL